MKFCFTDTDAHAKAVCRFDKNTCGWFNDPNNWLSKWRLQRQALPSMKSITGLPILCLQAIASDEEDTESSWISGQGIVEAPNAAAKSSNIQARIWSPTVPASLGFRCLKFVYTFHLGSSIRPPPKVKQAALALLQRQEGCFIFFAFIYLAIHLNEE